ncbi:unnamed protein product [Vitrella brassicaformis CCMP3155]|uniref:RAP domain-containing protein n=1 Tax=Vitrella brassicaformis (strain CCMP3155) TaxID=1169540 RepID=A0A0G4FA41_VITBC|nr:unnamed protein product [Vitrella brassicaformis CCMP3155]|eukprot:CEM09755.1 unnamed protein product [Vitrella brassicaformis CCMP3155]
MTILPLCLQLLLITCQISTAFIYPSRPLKRTLAAPLHSHAVVQRTLRQPSRHTSPPPTDRDSRHLVTNQRIDDAQTTGEIIQIVQQEGGPSPLRTPLLVRALQRAACLEGSMNGVSCLVREAVERATNGAFLPSQVAKLMWVIARWCRHNDAGEELWSALLTFMDLGDGNWRGKDLTLALYSLAKRREGDFELISMLQDRLMDSQLTGRDVPMVMWSLGTLQRQFSSSVGILPSLVEILLASACRRVNDMTTQGVGNCLWASAELLADPSRPPPALVAFMQLAVERLSAEEALKDGDIVQALWSTARMLYIMMGEGNEGLSAVHKALNGLVEKWSGRLVGRLRAGKIHKEAYLVQLLMFCAIRRLNAEHDPLPRALVNRLVDPRPLAPFGSFKDDSMRYTLAAMAQMNVSRPEAINATVQVLSSSLSTLSPRTLALCPWALATLAGNMTPPSAHVNDGIDALMQDISQRILSSVDEMNEVMVGSPRLLFLCAWGLAKRGAMDAATRELMAGWGRRAWRRFNQEELSTFVWALAKGKGNGGSPNVDALMHEVCAELPLVLPHMTARSIAKLLWSLSRLDALHPPPLLGAFTSILHPSLPTLSPHTLAAIVSSIGFMLNHRGRQTEQNRDAVRAFLRDVLAECLHRPAAFSSRELATVGWGMVTCGYGIREGWEAYLWAARQRIEDRRQRMDAGSCSVVAWVLARSSHHHFTADAAMQQDIRSCRERLVERLESETDDWFASLGPSDVSVLTASILTDDIPIPPSTISRLVRQASRHLPVTPSPLLCPSLLALCSLAQADEPTLPPAIAAELKGFTRDAAARLLADHGLRPPSVDERTLADRIAAIADRWMPCLLLASACLAESGWGGEKDERCVVLVGERVLRMLVSGETRVTRQDLAAIRLAAQLLGRGQSVQEEEHTT